MKGCDEVPTTKELSKATDSLACGKAPGKDGIPHEVIKVGKPTALLQHLHECICQCWIEGKVPQDMHNASIVTLYKNKWDHSDCCNYRGISLLSIVGKVYAQVVPNRLQLLTTHGYPESQCGFRSGKSITDISFHGINSKRMLWAYTTTLCCIH